MIQAYEIANLRTPMYNDGQLEETEETLLSQDELEKWMKKGKHKYGFGLYHYVSQMKISEGRYYQGQYVINRNTIEIHGLGSVWYPDGSTY